MTTLPAYDVVWLCRHGDGIFQRIQKAFAQYEI